MHHPHNAERPAPLVAQPRNGEKRGHVRLKMNQLIDFRRGTLTDVNSDGIPDTVMIASRTQSWAFEKDKGTS